jgi:hypothetical protein
MSGGRGVKLTTPFLADIRNEWSYTSSPICLYAVYGDNFVLYLYEACTNVCRNTDDDLK